MKLTVSNKPNSKADWANVLFIFAGKGDTVDTSSLDSKQKAFIKNLQTAKTFQAKAKDTLFFRDHSDYGHLLLVGLGTKQECSAETLRQAAAVAYKKLLSEKFVSANLDCEAVAKQFSKGDSWSQAMAEGILLCNYSCDTHKATKKKELKNIQFVCSGSTKKHATDVSVAEKLISAVNFSRHLGDMPGNLMTPKILANETVKRGKTNGLKVTIWDKAKIKREKMDSFLGVSLGSENEPCMIVMEYKGGKTGKKPICFVGKGLTFDAGGISIKPAAGMDEMKYDMCGGANVIGTMMAIAELKLKVNAIAYVPATENMLGPMANKPGDIRYARNGKSIEILNTDAEGRLILADALVYASEKKPAAIIDAATLTGAVIMALSNIYTGVFTRDQKLMGKIQSAADKTGERVWQMPLCDDHVGDMKGTHADLSNMSSFRGGGSSTAAAFLEQFVDKDIPWAHFDIAGTAWSVSGRLPYCEKKSASGAIIRTFVELAKQIG